MTGGYQFNPTAEPDKFRYQYSCLAFGSSQLRRKMLYEYTDNQRFVSRFRRAGVTPGALRHQFQHALSPGIDSAGYSLEWVIQLLNQGPQRLKWLRSGFLWKCPVLYSRDRVVKVIGILRSEHSTPNTEGKTKIRISTGRFQTMVHTMGLGSDQP